MAFSARVSDVPLAQINVTPLVDVLLVLLVIMMITAPVVTHRIKLDLPQPGHATPLPSDPVRLSIRADGSAYWNGVPVDAAMLEAQLALTSQHDKATRLLIDPADGAPYQAVANTLAKARRYGLTQIDFLAH